MKYEFVAAETVRFPVRLLCRMAGVAASAFYAWLAKKSRPVSDLERVPAAGIR